jgi:hypothetical protein
VAFLRFHRDKRGYEHFYLVEATTNRRGKSRSRVLYWFRTPPNLKIGREPFDDEVRRALEAQNPGVTFDWRKISETPVPSADAERWRERRRLERAAKAARRAGEEPAEIPEEDESSDLAAIADTDAAVDAAEQQADALAPTEESLVSCAATVETPAVEHVNPATRPGHRRRRRRRRPSHRETPTATAPTRAATEPQEPLEPIEPIEPIEPLEPLKPDDHEPR